MANNNGNGKRNQLGNVDGPQANVAQPQKRSDNLFDRHGNQQIHQAINTAQAEQKKPATVLSSMVDQEGETEQVQQQAQSEEWWKEDAQAQSQEEEEEQSVAAQVEPEASKETARDQRVQESAAEKMLMARAVLRGDDPSQVHIEDEAQHDLSSQEKNALAEVERQEAAGGSSEEAAMLALADAQGLDDQDKADMLMGSKNEVEQSDLQGQSGELQALLAAEQLPNEQLGDYDRDAASMASDTPLDERQTLRNLTDEIRLIAHEIHNHPTLLDPNATVEQKSTALIGVLALELDVPTRESVAAHPFSALTEDLIFDPMAMMEVNRVAGSRRDIRQLGSFAVILWQLTTDAARLELDAIGDEQMINEKDFLSGMLTGMANKMYVDALADPGW